MFSWSTSFSSPKKINEMMYKCNAEQRSKGIEFRIELKYSYAETGRLLRLRLSVDDCEAEFESFVKSNRLTIRESQIIREALEEAVENWHTRSMNLRSPTTNILE